MLKGPDSLTAYEWPPVELVLDRFEADLASATLHERKSAGVDATANGQAGRSARGG